MKIYVLKSYIRTQITLIGWESVNKAKALIQLTVDEVEGGTKITFVEKGHGPTFLMKLGASKVKEAHEAILKTFAASIEK